MVAAAADAIFCVRGRVVEPLDTRVFRDAPAKERRSLLITRRALHGASLLDALRILCSRRGAWASQFAGRFCAQLAG
eukprot:3442223-Alexandrium_andersonii.AAC.1